jgi:DNA-binding GntR family transcriptional regulator
METVVYRRLVGEIVRLELAPEAPLRLAEVAERLDVSATPVRQAIAHLKRDGLVVGSPRREMRVAPLTFAELEEIQAIRIGVESTLARYGAAQCDEQALATIEERFESTVDWYNRRDADEHLRAQWSLRDVCYGCADRPRLLSVVARERLRAERYLHYLSRADIDAFAESLTFQQALVLACRENDGDFAEQSTRDLFIWSLRGLREINQSGGLQPGAFV